MKNDKQQKNISKYLQYPWQEGGYFCKSPYIAALIDARSITRRNKKTGKKLSGKHGCWSGALAYMVLLNHIGDMFYILEEKKEKNKDKKYNKGYRGALYNFTNLSTKEIKNYVIILL